MDSSQSFYMDKLTLEYFTNKHTYRKYLAKTDPIRNQNILYEQIGPYKSQCVELFSQLFENNIDQDTLYSLRPKFESFIQECLHYLETQERHTHDDDKQNENFEHEQEDKYDTMFEEKHITSNIQATNPIEFWKAQQILKR